jgi:hypothetical protein
MGNFYTNLTLVGPSQQEIANAMREASRRSIVSPTSADATVIFDCASEAQDDSVYDLAESLTSKFRCIGLAVTNHDDSVLYYRLYSSGRVIDSYDSSPSYFSGPWAPPTGGNAKALCEAFHKPESELQIERILRDGSEDIDKSKYAFEMDRHSDLLKALKLPDWAVATGYNYLNKGEWPDGLTSTACISVDGTCTEFFALPGRHHGTDNRTIDLLLLGAVAVGAVGYLVRRRFLR